MTISVAGLILILFGLVAEVHLSTNVNYNYVALIDAGSSGSRMHVYRWYRQGDDVDNGVPKVEEVKSMKMKPGLSSLADNPDGVEAHLLPLVKLARDNVPSNKHSDTPIYLMATAGIRLVPRMKRKAIFAKVHATFENSSISSFKYDRGYSRILSGEEEGAFSWIGVNYNLGFFTNSSADAKSVGLLEMGGASMQIAFIPDGQILADKYPVKIGKRDYSLYVHSYLYYGQEYTGKRVRQYLYQQNPSATTLDNPCMLRGDMFNDTIAGRTYTFSGSSDHSACSAIIRTFLWKVSADRCHPSPCTIGNTYQPPLGNVEFYAIKAFVYPGKTLALLPPTGELSMSGYTAGADAYCSKDIPEAIQQIGERSRRYASGYCMMLTYIPLLLQEGLGFSSTENSIVATNSIAGKATDWPLGAVLYEVGRQCEVPVRPALAGYSLQGPTDDAPVIASHPLFVALALSSAFVVGW